jgi:hypothetical protein
MSVVALILVPPSGVLGAETLLLRQGLAISGVGRAGRSPVHTDAIEAQLVSGNWRRPAEGDSVSLPDGSTRQWRPVEAGTNGWFADESWRNAYLFVPMTVASNCVMLLEAAGDNLAYVNGAPRAGDPYEHGYVHLPVALHAGTNDLLFQCSRGRVKVSLTTPSAPVALDLADQTLPDLIVGQKADTWGAVVVVNATAEAREGLVLRAALTGQRATEAPVPEIPPLSIRKVGFHLRGSPPASGDSAEVALTLLAGRHQVLHSASLKLRLRRPDQTQKHTFISDIDGSVQYWALNPAQPIGDSASPPALFLTVHGASVEAIGQADAYSPKSWGHLVAPTNRRPYGFDWESWGRLDALEVLALAEAQLHPDPQRITSPRSAPAPAGSASSPMPTAGASPTPPPSRRCSSGPPRPATRSR